MKAYVENVVETIYEYVPPDRVEAAIAKLERALIAMGAGSGNDELQPAG